MKTTDQYALKHFQRVRLAMSLAIDIAEIDFKSQSTGDPIQDLEIAEAKIFGIIMNRLHSLQELADPEVTEKKPEIEPYIPDIAVAKYTPVPPPKSKAKPPKKKSKPRPKAKTASKDPVEKFGTFEHMKDWVKSNCLKTEDGTTRSFDMYKLYTTFGGKGCSTKHISINMFGRYLTKLGFSPVKNDLGLRKGVELDTISLLRLNRLKESKAEESAETEPEQPVFIIDDEAKPPKCKVGSKEHIADFIKARCNISQNLKVTVRILHRAYTTWCRLPDAISRFNFRHHVVDLGYKLDGSVFTGLAIKA